MKTMWTIALLALAISLAAFGQMNPAEGQAYPNQASTARTGTTGTPAGEFFTPSAVRWTAAPDSLPGGGQLAVLEGDPNASGPFTMRLKMPDGYQVGPHWHPNIEHITVISGVFHMGMGDRFDQSAASTLPVGSFSVMQAGTHHYAWAQGETVIQIHGIGPWGIFYVNPSGDPRNPRR